MTRIDLSQIAVSGRYIRSAFVRCRSGLVALGIAALTLIPSPLFAQQREQADERSKPTGQRPDVPGFPLDWSNKHVTYRPGISLEEVRKNERDPRYWRQKAVTEHNAAIATRRKEFDLDEFLGRINDKKKKKTGDPMEIDWAVSLGTGAVAQNMSPAKYSYAGPASCSDWVVFGLNTTPAPNQATLIAVNNLYGTANGCTANPGVLFSYQTAGRIQTSPVISYNDGGLQVAYVDNEGGKATFVVLKYKAGDGTAAAAPVAVPGTGSQVQFQYSATTNTNSSPYIDFFNDVAYVGDDAGNLYKLSPVFGGGTPAQVWVAALGGKLTGPIQDQFHDNVLVGSDNGKLYSQKTSDGTAASVSSPLTVGTGSIIDPPTIVSGTTTYAFVTTDCNAASNAAGLFEASISGQTGATFTALASRDIGENHGACVSNNLHAATLDDASYNGGAGFVYVCGTFIKTTQGPFVNPQPPTLYSFSFPSGGGTIGAAAASSVQPSGTNASDECSPLTYFTSNSTSKLFWGMGGAGSASSVDSLTVTGTGVLTGTITKDTAPNGLGGTSGISIDNASSTSSLANIYFSGLSAGNVTAGVTPGGCKSFSVSGASTGTAVTLTGTALNFTVGSTIVVSGFVAPRTAYNGTFVVTAIGGTTTVSYTAPGATTHASAGGTASWGTCGFQLTQTGLN
jgi:hypothetical protein